MNNIVIFLFCIFSSTIAVCITYILLLFGVPGFLALPICAVIAWYVMGGYMGTYRKRKEEEKEV
jgi:hypothetical protein